MKNKPFWFVMFAIAGGFLYWVFQPQQRIRVMYARHLYENHCKDAGVKIYQQVSGVNSVFLLKTRPETTNFDNQFRMDDPYGHDSGGDYYIQEFLRENINPKHAEPKMDGDPKRRGYLYVEAIDPKDGQRYRYTGDWEDVLNTDPLGPKPRQWYSHEFVLKKEPVTGPAPRYGVTYDDISTHKDREYWIAGSSLRVVDLQTNQVIAERIGYMWDPGQGNDSAGRSPWLLAANYACPGFHRNPKRPRTADPQQLSQTEDFVELVLVPNWGN